MILDCKAQNCEPCGAGGHDCPDQWEVLSTSVLTIQRKFPGFTLIPDELASNCPICKTQQGEPCIIPFVYDYTGKTYYGCADNEQPHDPWCPTAVNDQGIYISGSGTQTNIGTRNCVFWVPSISRKMGLRQIEQWAFHHFSQNFWHLHI